MPLTDTACRNARAKDKAYKLTDGAGLHLLVKPNGGRYWRMKYYFAGKEKLLSFGTYPEVTLAEARERREKARKLLGNNVDPSAVRKVEKQQRLLNAENTFEAIAREWHQNKISSWTERHGANVLHRLEVDIFPVLGRRPIADIEAPELLAALRRVEARGALEIAKRLNQTCGQVFRYAIATGRAKRNPVPDLRDALKPIVKGHYAAIEIKELPDFMKALEQNDARLYALTRLAIRLMLLTFVRTGELIGAKWTEFDLEDCQWTIPAERMKMRSEHIVPLSKQTLAILRELKLLTGNRAYLFPNQARPTDHMSNNTILGALKRLGYQGKMTGHGFRALAMSAIKEKLGYRHEVVDRQLAHAPRNKVDAAYDRAKFLGDRKKMMQHWADYLDSLLAKAKPLTAKRAA
jgi:integrase